MTEKNETENKLLSLTNDAVMKLFFTNKENEEQLRQFLKATTHLTDDDLATIDIKDSKLTKQHVQEKDFIVDIRLTSTTGEKVNIEIQARNHDGFKHRENRKMAKEQSRNNNKTHLKTFSFKKIQNPQRNLSNCAYILSEGSLKGLYFLFDTEAQLMKKIEAEITILRLTIDGIFKMYFEDSRNLPELRNFLLTHLELDEDELETITVLNPGLLKDNATDKGFTVDLLLKTKLGNDIHLEMQTSPHLNFNERVQLYNARKADSQIKVGEYYTKAKRTISLIITNFPVFDDADDYQETIFMRRKNNKVFTNVQEMHIIDLTKINSVAISDKQKYLWGQLLRAESKEALEMLAKESDEMAMATQKLIQISADERAQAYAMSWENSEFARKLHEQGLVDLGIEQGHASGREEKAIEMAKSLLKSGMSVTEVTKHAKLPLEVIEQLT